MELIYMINGIIRKTGQKFFRGVKIIGINRQLIAKRVLAVERVGDRDDRMPLGQQFLSDIFARVAKGTGDGMYFIFCHIASISYLGFMMGALLGW